MREHNRIAKNLAKINPNWNDDQLFEESRRIVGAQIQHITYSEFLPSILGQQMIDQYDLRPLTTGHYMNYDININPGIDNAVGAAVFPFMYTMLPSRMERYSKDLNVLGSIKMGDTYFDPTELYKSTKLAEYLMGMLSQTAHGSDLIITDEMTNGVLTDSKEGIDFVATIIQQGRDHALMGYTEWRKACGTQPSINSFNDLKTIMRNDVIKRLSQIYE